MKKILVTAATLVMSIAPAAAAHADTTNISANEDQSYSTSSSTDNGSNSSVEQSSTSTVSYEALYYVKYSASETNYMKAVMSDWSNSQDMDEGMHNSSGMFHNNMGGMGGSWGNSQSHEN